MKLVQFIELTHLFFGKSLDMSAIELAATASQDDYNDDVRAVLIECGWVVKTNEQPNLLVLSNETGMVHAFVNASHIISFKRNEWFGGFMLTTPYPKDPEREYEEIKKRLSIFNDDKEIARYKRIMPGLLAADISVNVMKVTTWIPSGIDRHSQDFALWTKIFESLFDELDFSESYGPGEQMFNCMYDKFWQWTKKTESEIRAMLEQIGTTSVNEEEVVRRVREELEYPFDNIRVIDGFSFLDQKKPFFVEITSPLGRFARINVNGW
ncbi:MAG: hypothetical protein UU48_C0004G0063 [Candidatus Uhrbacteria bacterium GW2011_GWF2_41_16]|uniref:Uncharacterized protein n=1 Tax=Candidatus Uhrbacteria bacterium GW2011_GWF2_41_16 TaxID=1618997 RepID=A0A0G0XN90_9BACT|nr:MAG: hypothetical protein UU48_C0004G0063 [Candidatus Uhrbacteria bacterium GW2011_GWF2_41_16]HBP00406.1 hypothetical protein [Candidatus Uhrbacteria bacterium]